MILRETKLRFVHRHDWGGKGGVLLRRLHRNDRGRFHGKRRIVARKEAIQPRKIARDGPIKTPRIATRVSWRKSQEHWPKKKTETCRSTGKITEPTTARAGDKGKAAGKSSDGLNQTVIREKTDSISHEGNTIVKKPRMGCTQQKAVRIRERLFKGASRETAN